MVKTELTQKISSITTVKSSELSWVDPSIRLRQMTDAQLLFNTKKLAATEREILAGVLRHLAEIQRRKLFSPRYPSLYDYAQKELCYSSDQAARRISAMRLIQELPEIETQIADGRLSLTTLGLAQTHFRNENLQREEKLQALMNLEGKSTREATRILIAQSKAPEKFVAPETVRPVSPTMNEMRICVKDETLEKIARLKGLLAHKHPHLSNGDVFEIALEIAIEKLNPSREPFKNHSARRSENETRQRKSPQIVSVNGPHQEPAQESYREVGREQSRTASAELKRQVWRLANGRCQRCRSQHALEIDHRQPFKLGGKTSAENLRLLCRNCNQREAIKIFGRLNTKVAPDLALK